MDDIATIFRSKNALDCRILHMQSQIFFPGVGFSWGARPSNGDYQVGDYQQFQH